MYSITEQMIGTSISMKNSVKMKYPSITICDGEDARIFGRERFFESNDHYFSGTSNGTKNLTFSLTPDLTKMFLSLVMNMPNKTTFTLMPDDLDDRYHLNMSIKMPYISNSNH